MIKHPIFICILILSFSISGIAYAAPTAHQNPKIIILEFHGLNRDILKDNLESLPNFQTLIKGTHNRQDYIHLTNVFTTIPAASVPACTAMYTGLYPKNNGVVSTIWYDRETQKVRTMISYGQQRINKLLKANGIKTIFDYLTSAERTSLSTMLMIDKGANWSIKSGLFFWGNASTVAIFKNRKWFPDPWYMDHKTISAALSGHLFSYSKSLAGLLEKQGTIPDVTVIQLLGTDIMSHFPNVSMTNRRASMNEIQSDYTREVLDPQVGRLIRFFKKNHVYNDTIFFLISQQGAIKIEKHIPDNQFDDNLASVFNMTQNGYDRKDVELVVMPGACTKEIYLRNRQTADWMDPPRLLKDVKPAVDLLLEETTIQHALNALVIRQYPGERDEGISEKGVWWGLDWASYQQGLRKDQDFLKALQPLKTALDQLELRDYLVKSLVLQYTRQTAPDIKLINKKGVYFEVDFKKYGHHGSYYPEDTQLSFWIAGPGLSKIIPGRHIIEAPASTLDLIPMVTYLLDIPPPTNIDGNNPLEGLK